MIADLLKPRLELLQQEYVLVQAWKKTASYIRYHNWYSDTLELDRTAVNLPIFLGELAEQLKPPDQWRNDPLRIVPAPKSQQWEVKPGPSPGWNPVPEEEPANKLRPLAHVSLRDQVVATAVMLCLADRVETLQGDPRDSITSAQKRKGVVSYGNRLFCDNSKGNLRHRWGSAKLYRAYYQDYQTFLSRPERVATALRVPRGTRIVIVQSDLRQFYDRVRPRLLARKIDALKKPGDDPQFYSFVHRLLNWQWDGKDSGEVARYAKHANLSDFSSVALPQGLVAAGFYANVALLDFDQRMQRMLSQEVGRGIRLEDFSRYVDDMRIVLTVDRQKSLTFVEDFIKEWLQKLLDLHAKGLEPSEDKTRAVLVTGDERPLVFQSRKMERIQGAISGGFDAVGGEEILDAVQGLIRSQQRYSKHRAGDKGWEFSPIPDVRDATVARFAAARFRSTYRSLRPLLAGREILRARDDEYANENSAGSSRVARTRAELDDEGRAFALGLIENWIGDPSNVRLLRIGLDLWPSEDVLKNVLGLLRPFTKSGGRGMAAKRVALYCLAEIFRAGATETGLVEDSESLPAELDIDSYRAVLRKEAVRLASLPQASVPWYLSQQVLLFLATSDVTAVRTIGMRRRPETRHYRNLVRFLSGKAGGLTNEDYATFAILSRRALRGKKTAVQLARRAVNALRLKLIFERDPSFALEILKRKSDLAHVVPPRLRNDLCLNTGATANEWRSLAVAVLQDGPLSPLRNEFTLLHFASKFLAEWPLAREARAITPSNVLLKLKNSGGTLPEVDAVKIVESRDSTVGSMYSPPAWSPPDERWRFHLGYLLRFILSARPDFTEIVRPTHWKEGTTTYRTPKSHWYQRLYGLYNGHSAFGDDWLPISDWTERLLFALLSWPGCRSSEMAQVRKGIKPTRNAIEGRLRILSEKQGPANSVMLLPLRTNRPDSASADRPLRACVEQTVIPAPEDFKLKDLTLTDPVIRRSHRNHLSAALAAIERMLDLRATHKGHDGRLDWLILPELSVHPRDVRTHLVPFARAHKTIILAGLTYEALIPGQPLVNSALWVIPVWSPTHGLQILTRRQGKQHLAPDEEKLNARKKVLHGFRPCQWLVGYDWSNRFGSEPLWLTASICYDATDLSLASALRSSSDVFAIPALNKDVSTFDQMAMALHYHMFQLIIVANNGLYGGSNAYQPYRESYVRQIFHLHGQPQASVAFLEIDPIEGYLRRKADARAQSSRSKKSTGENLWKLPPAGM